MKLGNIKLHERIKRAISHAGPLSFANKSIVITEYHPLVTGVLDIIKEKDYPTYVHSVNVRYIAKKIATYILCYDRHLIDNIDDVEKIAVESLLHDFGKIFFNDKILKEGKNITDEEYNNEIIKHPDRAAHLLGEVLPQDYLDTIVAHHERFDGKLNRTPDFKHPGYPKGLKEEQIPLTARIISVADMFEAVYMGRPYKAKLSLDQVMNLLEAEKGKQFDPNIVNYFINMLKMERDKNIIPFETQLIKPY